MKKSNSLLFTTLVIFTYCSNSSKNEAKKSRTLDYSKISETVYQLDSSTSRTGSVSKNFLLGKFDYHSDTNFVRVPDSLSLKEAFIQKQVFRAFFAMRQAANKENVRLTVISGTRNFAEQKGIWERKWSIESKKSSNPIVISKQILKYSSMPSTSRHHWGTDIDLNSLQSNYFKSGIGLSEYTWLKANARKYGFHQVYSNKLEGRTGYNEEEWHWSYMPLSSKYLDFYNKSINYTDIKGFIGSENAVNIKIIEEYVNGIDNWN